MARITKIVGVNSELDTGEHVLMWDFDNQKLEDVKRNLRVVQSRYLLSDIIILQSSPPDNWVAYCFTRTEFQRAAEIIAATEGIDWNFFKFGVYRHRFTLRVDKKNDVAPVFAARLEGLTLPDCDIDDLNSWVRYETLAGVM